MSRGHWRKLAKTLGLVLVGLVAVGGLSLAALFSYREFYEPAEQDQTVQHYQPARDSTQPPATVEGKPRSEAYDPNCEQPQNYQMPIFAPNGVLFRL